MRSIKSLAHSLAGRLVVGGEEGLVIVLAAVGHLGSRSARPGCAPPGLLDGRHQRVGVGRCEHDAGHFAVDGVLHQVDLVGNG